MQPVPPVQPDVKVPPARKRKRRWRYIVLSILCLLIAGGCWVCWPVSAPPLRIGRDTTYLLGPVNPDGTISYVAAINEMFSEGVTPQNNAAVDLLRALGPAMIQKNGASAVLHALKMGDLPPDGDYFVEFDAFMHARYPERIQGKKDAAGKVRPLQGFEIESRCLRDPGDPISSKVREPLEAWVRANEKPLSRIAQASGKARFFIPVCSPSTPPQMIDSFCCNASLLAEVGEALGLRARFHVTAGELDDAWADTQALHRLGGLLCQQACWLVVAQVGVGLDGYASRVEAQFATDSRLSADRARAMLAQLRSLPELPSVERQITLGQRCLMLDSVMGIIRAPAKMLSGQPAPARLAGKIDFNLILRRLNAEVDATLAPWHVSDYAERERMIDRHHDDYQKWVQNRTSDAAAHLGILTYYARPPGLRLQYRTQILGDWLLPFMMPSLGHSDDRRLQAAMRRQLVEIAFALAAWHAEKGGYPAALADLVPEYLPGVPPDLFSGKPLIYRRSDGGYLLYSVGPNMRDDGGEWSAEHKFDDIAIRTGTAASQPG